MAKVILICGKICSGKTTYAKRLLCENKAVLLSTDFYRDKGINTEWHYYV
jgi:uridine kinase